MKEAVSIERKFISLNPREARTVAIIFERMFPADENGPGATEIDVVNYVDKALAGPYGEKLEWYRLGLAALERVACQSTEPILPNARRPIRMSCSPNSKRDKCRNLSHRRPWPSSIFCEPICRKGSSPILSTAGTGTSLDGKY